MCPWWPNKSKFHCNIVNKNISVCKNEKYFLSETPAALAATSAAVALGHRCQMEVLHVCLYPHWFLDDPFYMLHVCLYHMDSNTWMILFTCYMCVCITWTQTIGWSFLHITCVSVSHGLKHLDDPFYMLHVCLYHLDSNIWMIPFTCYMCVCITWTQTFGWSFLHVTCVSISHGLKHLDDPFYMLHVCLYHLNSNTWMILLLHVCLYQIFLPTFGWSF